MLSVVNPLTALKHIAAFSAGLRGHELENWEPGERFALATCIRCKAQVRVYYSPLQPEVAGDAITCKCGAPAVKRVA
jgi:hypothetical protein